MGYNIDIRDDRGRYDLELRGMSPAEALQVFCLVTHVKVTPINGMLMFTRYFVTT